MVALLYAAGAVRDMFLAAGLGFLLGMCYRALRLVLGDGAKMCFLCDVTVFAIGATAFRAAAAGAFASGVMRWYTALCLLCGYALCQKILAKPCLAVAHQVRRALTFPWRMFYAHIWQPVRGKYAARRAKRQKIRAAKKTAKKSLQNPPHVLYNSQ